MMRALGPKKKIKTQHFNIGDNQREDAYIDDFNVPNKGDSSMDDFQDVLSDGINKIEDNHERRLAALRHRVADSLDDHRKQDYLGNITRLNLHNNKDSDSEQDFMKPGIIENTFDGITDVVKGGAKVAMTGGKMLYHTTKAVYNAAQFANNLLPGSASSSSINPPIKHRLRVKSTPVSEASADENRRRNIDEGEPVDSILDDFIKRKKFGPKQSRNK